MKNDDPYMELAQIAGSRAGKVTKKFEEAVESYTSGRYKDALRDSKSLHELYPQALGVQELYGMSLYSAQKFPQALKVLEDYAEKSGSLDQHPLIMDCYRANKNYKKIDELWNELGSVSPDGAVVAEGRIVHSQALAEQGRLDEALRALRKKVKPLARPKDHHLRLWYCLADLEERAGNIVVARQWFSKIQKFVPDFADIDYRIKQLS